MREHWKYIIGYEGFYMVSNFGNIKSLNYKRTGKPKILKPSYNHKGYPTIGFYRDKNYKCFLIHRLVAQAFIPNPENKPQVNHKNGIKTNNLPLL